MHQIYHFIITCLTKSLEPLVLVVFPSLSVPFQAAVSFRFSWRVYYSSLERFFRPLALKKQATSAPTIMCLYFFKNNNNYNYVMRVPWGHVWQRAARHAQQARHHRGQEVQSGELTTPAFLCHPLPNTSLLHVFFVFKTFSTSSSVCVNTCSWRTYSPRGQEAGQGPGLPAGRQDLPQERRRHTSNEAWKIQETQITQHT